MARRELLCSGDRWARGSMREQQLHIVLYRPEIPQNTGSIIRLCANTGAHLHLIRPMGFVMDDTRLRRAGLDYHEFATVAEWDGLDAYVSAHPDRRLVAVETSGCRFHSDFDFAHGDTLVFGSESQGLPAPLLAGLGEENVIRLPMLPDRRSLNLANAVSVVAYEAWCQLGYEGAV